MSSRNSARRLPRGKSRASPHAARAPLGGRKLASARKSEDLPLSLRPTSTVRADSTRISVLSLTDRKSLTRNAVSFMRTCAFVGGSENPSVDNVNRLARNVRRRCPLRSPHDREILARMPSKVPERSRGLVLLRHLMDGERHDRDSAAKLLGVNPPNAYLWMRVLKSTIPGVEWVDTARRGRAIIFRRRDPDAPPSVLALAACLTGSLAPLFGDSGWRENIAKARDYLVKRVEGQHRFEHLSRKFLFGIGGGEPTLTANREHALDDVIDAVLRSRPLTFRYDAVSRPRERKRVQPLSLAIYQHQLYVIARDDATTRPHPYRFARMLNVSVGKKAFPYPTNDQYNPDSLLSDSIGMYVSEEYPLASIRIRLSGMWATYAATHCWHVSQDVTPPDEKGSVVVSWTMRTCPELQALILSFGESAEVLAPATLRAEIAEQLERARLIYVRARRLRTTDRGARTAKAVVE